MATRKNILLILTDQQSWHMMGCAGNTHLFTPAMDSMAARGIRFDLAFCANPVCSPSRFSIFTRRYGSEVRQRNNGTHRDALTPRILETGLGHVVRKAGYTATYAGKEVLIESEFGFGIRANHFFYVGYDRGEHREQLYDLAADPGQTRTFIREPAFCDVWVRYRRLLDDHLAETSNS